MFKFLPAFFSFSQTKESIPPSNFIITSQLLIFIFQFISISSVQWRFCPLLLYGLSHHIDSRFDYLIQPIKLIIFSHSDSHCSHAFSLLYDQYGRKFRCALIWLLKWEQVYSGMSMVCMVNNTALHSTTSVKDSLQNVCWEGVEKTRELFQKSLTMKGCIVEYSEDKSKGYKVSMIMIRVISSFSFRELSDGNLQCNPCYSLLFITVDWLPYSSLVQLPIDSDRRN